MRYILKIGGQNSNNTHREVIERFYALEMHNLEINMREKILQVYDNELYNGPLEVKVCSENVGQWLCPMCRIEE
jgi:hypothetical protein